MKRSIRFFSIGLLTSTLLMFGYYFFFEKDDSLETISSDRLIATIEEDGYRVITEDEFISFSLYKEMSNEEDEQEEAANETDEDKEKEDNTADEEDKDADKEAEKDEVKEITFTTDDGVVSQDIADILIEKKIIDDRQKFLDYLDDNDYSGYIQVGKFEVSDDMSFKELAEIVTTYPGD